MTSERVEWVEIIEPRTKEHMYANLTTGDCVWDPPEGVHIKRTDNSQWWELFDTNTSRFYYYNVASQKTVWHRPQNCDIIPLAKLQTLKQNTDPSERRDKEVHSSRSKLSTSSSCGASATGTGSRSGGGGDNHQRSSSSSGHARGQSAQDKYRNSDVLGSPQGRQSLHHRFPTVEDGSMIRTDKFGRYGGPQANASSSSRNSHKYMDSSDSGISSAHGYRRLNESGPGMVGGGGSLRIGHSSGALHSKKPTTDSSNHRMLQESSSSHNIPHISLPSPQHSQPSPHHQKLSYSASNSSDLAGNSPSHSISTPQLKKKLNLEKNGGTSREGAITKHQSFDYSGSPAAISLIRSGSFMSSSGLTGSAARQYQMQRKGSFDGNSDDSMHEKYFKSVENTPVSRRRHTTTSKPNTAAAAVTHMSKHSSDSSPQSPVSPKTSANSSLKPVRPSALPMDSTNNYKSSQKSDPDHFNMDVTSKPERYLDKMKLDKDKERITPNSGPSNLISLQQFMKPPPNTASSHTQNDAAVKINSLHKNASGHAINKETLEKKSTQSSSKAGGRKKKASGYQGTTTSDMEFDNGNLSPLYSNWDPEMHEHLLPLQNYILEQAKLSGCHGGFGDAYNDSDSLHSDTQSEHSFSGHEPDNEDSDHSDGRGDYLSHYPYDEYGASHRCEPDGPLESYYNFERTDDKEDISEEVEAKLESMQQDQIYSPVKNHPPLPKLPLFPPAHPKPFPKPNEPSDRDLPPKRFLGVHHPVPMGFPPQFHPPQQPMQHQHTQQKTAQKSNLLQRLQENLSSNNNDKIAEMALLKECDIEKFAQDNLNLHSKGIFRKKSSIRDMLSWTSEAISRPMLSLARDKVGKKMATELFKLVQIYMGDRKARPGMSLNSVALDIMSMAVTQPQLRDELYVQLCRQTTENPMRDSLIRGWELLAICLAFIPPSPTFQPALLGYMNRHRDPTFATSFPEVGKWPIHVQISHYATIACRRLDRIGSAGKKQAKKPTVDEINHAREQIFRDSMFGNTLTEVMDLQKDKYPDRKLPWIQTTLSEQVLLLNGKQTEGIFRVPADVDEVSLLKARLDKWEFPDNKELLLDAHAPASLLKLWYRELYDPLIPDALYEECVQTDVPEEANKIIDKLPPINKLVLTYLIHFLQQFSLPDVVNITKMDSSNLAMVFAPNLLRCTSTSPQTILENSRKEMAFVRTLIQNLDTKSVANLK